MSAKIAPDALESSIDELDEHVALQKRNYQEGVRYIPSENSISRSATANSEISNFSKKECMVDEFLPFPIKELIITYRMIQLNQQARTLFVQYFMSGEWLNNLFDSRLSSSWWSAARKTRIVIDGSSSSGKRHRSFLHSVSSSRKASAMTKLIDLFPPSKLRSLMTAIALQRYFQSPCFLSMIECQWSDDIDSVSFRSNQAAAVPSCLPWGKAPHPLQRLLAAKLPLLGRPDELQGRLGDDKWIWTLQAAIDNCPLGVGVYGLTSFGSTSQQHSNRGSTQSNNSKTTSKSLSLSSSTNSTSNESMKSVGKVLTGRFFNRSFAAAIGQRLEDLYQAPLDFGAMEPFPADTMTAIMSALNSGEGVQVIAEFNLNNSSSCLLCLSLQPVMDYRKNRLVKAVCVPRVMPFCGPADCAQDLLAAEHLATLLAASV